MMHLNQMGGGYEPEEVKYIKLGDISDIRIGSKPPVISETDTKFEYINAGTTNSGYVGSYNCEGDIVTTPSRGQGGIGYVGYQESRFWLGPLCYGIKANKDISISRYVYYALASQKSLILQEKKEGSVPALNLSDLSDIEIPVPPLETQKRIVSILDKFEMLANSLIDGLPAEIEARKKQYEYYRDLLLDFKIIGGGV